jgi:hypothetical protein
MKKFLCALAAIGLAAVGHQPMAHAQAQTVAIATFGDLNYTPPEGCSKKSSADYVEYSSIDNKRKTFLKLAIFGSTTSTGDLASDSKVDWAVIAVKQFGAPAIPSANQVGTLAGSPGIFLTGTFEFDKRTITITTFTTRVGNRKSTVLAMSDDISFYLPTVRQFLAGITKIETQQPPSISETQDTRAPSVTTDTSAVLGAMPRTVAELYNLSLPKHFIQQKTDNLLVATDSSTNTTLSFLPATTGSGNLPADANAVLAAALPGWQPVTGWQQNSTRLITSTTAAGVPYVVLHQDMEQGEKKIIASVVVFAIGNKQIASVVGQTAHLLSAINWIGYEAILSTVALVAHAVDFKHLKLKPSAIALENSTWQSISSSGGLVLTFHPKGTFSSGAATRTTVSHSDTHDRVTSTSWSNDGTWALKGNLLTLVYRATKMKSQSLIRLAVEESDGRRDEFLGMLDLSTGGEARLSKSQ